MGGCPGQRRNGGRLGWAGRWPAGRLGDSTGDGLFSRHTLLVRRPAGGVRWELQKGQAGRHSRVRRKGRLRAGWPPLHFFFPEALPLPLAAGLAAAAALPLAAGLAAAAALPLAGAACSRWVGGGECVVVWADRNCALPWASLPPHPSPCSSPLSPPFWGPPSWSPWSSSLRRPWQQPSAGGQTGGRGGEAAVEAEGERGERGRPTGVGPARLLVAFCRESRTDAQRPAG